MVKTIAGFLSPTNSTRSTERSKGHDPDRERTCDWLEQIERFYRQKDRNLKVSCELHQRRRHSRAFVCGLSSPVLGLHSVRLSYLWAVLPSVPRHWRFPPASGGHPPRLLPPGGGIAWHLRRPRKENADRADGIFGLAGRVWVSALRPDPP